MISQAIDKTRGPVPLGIDGVAAPPGAEDGLARLGRRLHALSRMMGRLGALCTFFFGLQFYGVIAVWVTRRSVGVDLPDNPEAFWITVVLVVSAIQLMIVFFFDRLRRMADALYEETGDRVAAMPTSSWGSEVVATVKLAMKSYARASSLPLFPGRSGVAIYVAASSLLMVFSLHIARW